MIVAKLLIAWALMSACVMLHAVGTVLIMRGLIVPRLSSVRGNLFITWLVTVFVTCFATLHFIEIALWAFFYYGAVGIPDMETALYFSAVTYTTVGYGDIVLPSGWRLVAGAEALTGILMVGWTSALIFFVLIRVRLQREAAGHVVPFIIDANSDDTSNSSAGCDSGAPVDGQ
jgi:hypothetical protein